MIEYGNIISEFTGRFWLAEDPRIIFEGEVKRGELIIETTDNRIMERIYSIWHSRSLLFHSKSELNQEMTLQVSLLKFTDSNPGFFSMTFNVIFVFYNISFNSLDEIKFRSVIVNFTNTDEWITPYQITFSSIAKDRTTIEIDLGDEYILYFLSKPPIKDSDVSTNDKSYAVYVKIVSKKGKRYLHEWLKIKQTIQDFLNFVITGQNVLVHSMYGINDNSTADEAEIQFKSFITERMNKCTYRKSTLFMFSLYQNRIQTFLINWFRFSRNEMLYSLFFDYMYEETTTEMRVFKLVSFFEAFHHNYVFDKKTSIIHKEKIDRKVRILDKLSVLELDDSDRKYLLNKIGDTRLSLKEIFIELIEPLVEPMYTLNPIYSYVTMDEIKEIDLGLEPELKKTLINLIAKKKEIDNLDSELERNRNRHDLVSKINSNHRLALDFLRLTRHITMNNFSGVISEYRNIIGHSLSVHSKVHSFKWFFMAKILEFLSQYWILRKIFDLETQDIEDIYFLKKLDPIEMIIKLNIREYEFNSIY